MSEKKKWTRLQVGSIVKSKEPGKPDYLKVSNDVTLRKGQILKLESKKFKLDSIDEAVKAGRMSEETANKIRENVEKTPDWVRFEVVSVSSN